MAAAGAEARGASRGGRVAYLAKCARRVLDDGRLAKRPRLDEKPAPSRVLWRAPVRRNHRARGSLADQPRRNPGRRPLDEAA